MFDVSSPINDWLASEAMRNYRSQYRSFRLGHHQGARGDVSDVGYSSLQQTLQPPVTVDHNLELRESEVMTQLSQFRIAYRRFRIGGAAGASGQVEDLAKKLTTEQLEMLPVAQMLQLRRHTPNESSMGDEQAGLHIHIGGGRLGLGLILPAIEAKASNKYLVLQSRSGAWSEVADQSEVALFVNNVQSLRLFIVDAQRATVDDVKEKFQHHRGGVLLTRRGQACPLKDLLIQEAKSLSCSVGPGLPSLQAELLRILGPLRSPPVPLFACENDHAAVEKMSTALSNVVDVIPCMVDRICSGMASESRGREKIIRVTTEAFRGEIVVLDFCREVPLAGETVVCPKVKAQGQYFTERKILMVNGGHTVLAFLTMMRHAHTSFVPPGDFELLSWHTCSMQEKSYVWAFCIARLLLLIWQYDASVLRDAHNVADDDGLCECLMRYAQDTVGRFSGVSDTTKRILGGGVDNRFHGRLQNIEEFLNVCNPASTVLGRRLLEKMNIGFCVLAAEVHQLVSQAFQFTTEGRAASKPLSIPLPKIERHTRPLGSPTERRGVVH